jgi:hypothetical protein
VWTPTLNPKSDLAALVCIRGDVELNHAGEISPGVAWKLEGGTDERCMLATSYAALHARGAWKLARASSHEVSGIRRGLGEWQGFTKSMDGVIHTRISYMICQTKPHQGRHG